MKANSTIISHTSAGSGRSYIVLIEQDSRLKESAEKVVNLLSQMGQISLIAIRKIGKDWRLALEDILDFIENNGIRSASFIAFEDAAVIVQAICLKKPRLIRTIVFVDGVTRAHPSGFVTLIEKAEKFLPLGLPFRSDFPGFDGKPFLQRIRCPVLIALSAGAEPYVQQQAQLFLDGMPTSFLIDLPQNQFEDCLARAIESFQLVPAKSPQKNLRAQ